MLCDIPEGWSCQADGSQTVRVYGGRLVPRGLGRAAAGLWLSGLARLRRPCSAAPRRRSSTRPTAGLGGSIASGCCSTRSPRLSEIVDDNSGRCADVNPGNGDAYEFAHGRPCKLSAGRTIAFDTTALPEGSANLKILVEDAAGNSTTLLSRSVSVDNIPAPSIDVAPSVTGTLRRTHRLTDEGGVWNDHGAAGDPAVAYQWQRCDRLGANCQDIAGATDEDFTLTDDEVGRRVRVVETATNSEGETQAASAVSGIVTREDGTLPPGSRRHRQRR